MAESTSLSGKSIIMTGGAGNIGRASAILMAQHGGNVAIGDLDVPGTLETVDLITKAGGQAKAFEVDVRSETSVEGFVKQAHSYLGGIDAAFMNAGLQRSGTVDGFLSSDWDALFEVNPRHCFYMSKYIVPILKAQKHGTIVMTASLAGLKGGPGMTAYSASKGAIIGFGKALAAEMAPDDVRVNVLCPGWIDTAFNEPAISFMGGTAAHAQTVKAVVPLRRQGSNEEIAQAVLFLISEASSYMTGQSLVIDGGVY
jgi:NAD(P)-dependent dehydrogenase (short-subunit alcohol dehydrogenase family)